MRSKDPPTIQQMPPANRIRQINTTIMNNSFSKETKKKLSYGNLKW